MLTHLARPGETTVALCGAAMPEAHRGGHAGYCPACVNLQMGRHVATPRPRRPAGPYCADCGMNAGHWTGCPHSIDGR